MDNKEMSERIKSIKSRIEALIEKGYLSEANSLLEQIEQNQPGDTDVCSMRAIVLIMEGRMEEAQAILKEGLKKDSLQFDLVFNLGYISELQGLLRNAAEIYRKAGSVANTDDQKKNVDQALQRVMSSDSSIIVKDRIKLVFFTRTAFDKLPDEIIVALEEEYWIREIIVSDYKKIDEGMLWADICWFEGCDELIEYASKRSLSIRKKIICRFLSMEAIAGHISKVTWRNIDRVIFNTERARDIALNCEKSFNIEKALVIPNCIDTDRFKFVERKPGYKIAYVGDIDYKTDPILLLHAFKAIYDVDNNYKLYIGGEYQELRYALYFEQLLNKLGITKNVFFDGIIGDLDLWMKNKNYFITADIWEDNPTGLMEAMSVGIKPLIHNYVGARKTYPAKLIWSSIDDLTGMLSKNQYDSKEYRDFIMQNFSIDLQISRIRQLLSELLSYKEVIDKTIRFLRGFEKPEELATDTLTVLIPCFNRAQMLVTDMERGLKLGRQRKLIVDDCSTIQKEWFAQINQNNEKYNTELIRKESNEGLAQARWTGLHNIKTEYAAILDDDDMLLCLDSKHAAESIDRLRNGYVLVIPRYIINYFNDKLGLSYDRSCFDNWSAADILRDIASTGEIMALLAGGSVGKTEILKKYSQAKEFRVAEDFVMLSRILAANPACKICSTESLVHIRRTSTDTMSKTLSPYKLATGLLAHCITCYYCLSLNIASKAEVLEWMTDRAKFLQEVYEFGESFETELIAYLKGEISEEIFLHFLTLHGVKLFKNLDELAPELSKMRALICNAPEAEKLPPVLNELPLLSIIIPTFNRKDMLKRAIDQALKQSYPNIEIIVSDNCSEDGTHEMVKTDYANEKRLIYNRNDTNIGPTRNYQNALYSLARGKYCIMISDDDYLIDSSYLDKAVRLLENHEDMAFVFSGYYYNNEITQKSFRNLPDYAGIIDGNDFFIHFTMLKYQYMPNLCTTVFRIKNAKEMNILKTDPNCLAGDLSMLLRLLLTGKAGYINTIGLVYTLHRNSISLNTEALDISNHDKTQKVVDSAIQDINEMKKIFTLAKQLNRFKTQELNDWLYYRIWKYMYWRFNESVQTKTECHALVRFMYDNYPEQMDNLRGTAIKRFGEEVLEGVAK